MKYLSVLTWFAAATLWTAVAADAPRVPGQPKAVVKDAPLPPPVVDPAEPVQVASGVELMVEHSAPCIVRTFPKSATKVTHYALEKGEKHTFTGQFLGPDGPFTEKTYVGPIHLYRIKPVEDGDSVLMVLPVGGGEQDLVERRIRAGLGPKPPPPDVEPDATARKLHVVVIEDTRERTPEQGALLFDAEMRAWLKAGGHEIDVLSHRDEAVVSNGFKTYADRVGYPAVLVFDLDVKTAQKPLKEFRLSGDAKKFQAELKKLVKR